MSNGFVSSQGMPHLESIDSQIANGAHFGIQVICEDLTPGCTLSLTPVSRLLSYTILASSPRDINAHSGCGVGRVI